MIDIIRELQEFGCLIDVYDPWADADEVRHEYGLELLKVPRGPYEGVVLAVGHEVFGELDISELGSKDRVIYDVKAKLQSGQVDGRL